MSRQIKKVLIANRGEIALRIIRTLRSMGLETVIVYHAADAGSAAVKAADSAVEIFGDTPVSAYLDGDRIASLAREIKADAIHPGYGFLSENSVFAEKIEESDIKFIGPSAEVIALMGNKLQARDFVARRGFPVAPSLAEAEAGGEFAEKAAGLGFPLMIKAAAGGGGKGMQVVHEAAELEERIATARSEAGRYFGDEELYAEKFIERPRHIEVQVLADEHGNVIHLGERECSVQRRFQKVIEEAPSTALDDEKRNEICTTAVGIAQAAGYRGAGTIEFVMAPDGTFYFLEMNTRIQVEHPVTEMITGIDIVEEQVLIAQGKKLHYRQADISFTGHAVECRIYAEDPDAGFIPATGRLLVLEVPDGPGVRWDGGFEAGQQVSAAFDPMIAKLVVHGETRDQAIDRAVEALGRSVILGLETNTGWLRRALSHKAFRAGETDTGFVERHAEDLRRPAADGPLREAVLAAAALTSPDFLRTKVPRLYAAIGQWTNR